MAAVTNRTVISQSTSVVGTVPIAAKDAPVVATPACPLFSCENNSNSLTENIVEQLLKRLRSPFCYPYEGGLAIIGNKEHFAVF